MENQEFDFVVPVYHTFHTVRARLVAAEREIGLTVVDAVDSDKYYICLNGPKSPVCTKAGYVYSPSRLAKYYEAFDYVIRQVGSVAPVEYAVLSDMLSGGGGRPFGQETCAFGQ